MKKQIWFLLGISITLIFIMMFGPSVIHWYYRKNTSDAERMMNQQIYNKLAWAEISASGDELEQMRTKRMLIFYWFHARGWPIDEGDHEHYRPWNELFIYWSDS